MDWKVYFSIFTRGALIATSVDATRYLQPSVRSKKETQPIKIHERGLGLDPADETKLLVLGLGAVGNNYASRFEGEVWIGGDGDYTNEYLNESDEYLILVVWGPNASWVNVHQPLITVSLPPGTRKTLSFASGSTGAWAGVYSGTKLVNGQISETWGEYTFGEQGCVDVSREVNMLGHNMTIATETCVSDMETCVFKCKGNALTCWLEYELDNCENGSQPGATYGIYRGAPGGGCGNLGEIAKLKTFFY